MPIDLPPEPITLVVPGEYKRFFYRKWHAHLKWNLLMSLLLTFLGLIMFIADGFRVRYFQWGHPAAILILGLAWLYWLRNPLYYHVNKNGIVVIDCAGSTWSWHHISWKESVILSVTDSAWRDLPALTIRVGAKVDSDITYHSDWQLVYRPEDNHKVRDRVIPAIEYYRAKYGHEGWIAEHGWEAYAQPSELLTDA